MPLDMSKIDAMARRNVRRHEEQVSGSNHMEQTDAFIKDAVSKLEYESKPESDMKSVQKPVQEFHEEKPVRSEPVPVTQPVDNTNQADDDIDEQEQLERTIDEDNSAIEESEYQFPSGIYKYGDTEYNYEMHTESDEPDPDVPSPLMDGVSEIDDVDVADTDDNDTDEADTTNKNTVTPEVASESQIANPDIPERNTDIPDGNIVENPDSNSYVSESTTASVTRSVTMRTNMNDMQQARPVMQQKPRSAVPRIPSEKKDTRVRKESFKRPPSIRNDPKNTIAVPSFPKGLMQEVRNAYRDAANNSDALAAFVYARLGNPDLPISDDIRELVRTGDDDNTLVNMEQRMRKLEDLMYAMNDLLREMELAIAYVAFDRVGFRRDMPNSPADINFLENGMSDAIRKLRTDAARKKVWDNSENGRPIR